MSKKALGKGIGSGLDSVIRPDRQIGVEQKRDMRAIKTVNPRITVYSPVAASVLTHLKNTQPNFSKSKIACEILEEGLKKHYPEIWIKFE